MASVPVKQIAIIRGVEPDQAVEVTRVFGASGFDVVEVPLNSPQPLESIRRMAEAFGDVLQIGAGTVLTVKDVNDVAEAGGKLIVSPNTNPEVIRETKRLGLMSVPGVMTPTECFAALDAGADALKLFNAGTVGPHTLKAYRAVLPKDTPSTPSAGSPSRTPSSGSRPRRRLWPRRECLQARHVPRRNQTTRRSLYKPLAVSRHHEDHRHQPLQSSAALGLA